MNNRSKSKRMIRSNSSRGSLFGVLINKELSTTFSLSSLETSECDDMENFEDEVITETERKPLIETPVATANAPASIVLPPDARLPLEKTHSPRRGSNFFLESMIRRDDTKTRFIMYQQSATAALPIFCAEKYPPADGGQILIKSVHEDSDSDDLDENQSHILGSLVKKKDKQNKGGSQSITTYELFLHEPTSSTDSGSPLMVATIEYETVSRARKFIEGGRPRNARIHILGREGAETKEPCRKEGGQSVFDFHGRGRETSSKNTQLVSASGDCCLQMVKWQDQEFNLDFGAPFDAFHAFAFALAQFDF